MKKNRLIKMSQSKYICEKCGKEAKHIHHIDKNKSNHELSNLMAICPLCHAMLHKKTKIKTLDMKQYLINYYKENRIKILKYAKKKSKQYYHNNKEKILEYQKKYKVLYPEKIKAYREKYKLQKKSSS